jgi:hypothetical protein
MLLENKVNILSSIIKKSRFLVIYIVEKIMENIQEKFL